MPKNISDIIIDIQGITYTYPDGFQGIKDISLSICRKEFIILAGKNGSGKSTLLRHLNGLLLPDSGQIIVNDKNISDHLIATRKTVGMVFQDADAQIVGDTVFDEVAFGLENLKFKRAKIVEKVNQVLGQLDLYELKDRNPWALSGGEKRKLAIAGVLVMDPDVIVFDEPFSNLDYPGAVQVLSTIAALNQAGHTIIIATHDIETVISQASRIIIMEKGTIQQDGDPETLMPVLESYGVREPCSSKLGFGIQPWHK